MKASYKAISPVVSGLLLVIVAVAASIAVAVMMHSFSKPSSGVNGFFQIESVKIIPDEKMNGYYYAVKVTVRNPSQARVDVPENSMFIWESGVLVSKATKIPLRKLEFIDPGDVKTLTYYTSREVPPGEVKIEIAASGGARDDVKTYLNGVLGASAVIKVTPENTASNPIIVLNNYANYTVWVEVSGGNYNITFQVTPRPGVVIRGVRGEIFNCTGGHPVWVGKWSIWHWTSPYTYPNWAGAYWYPVKPSEMPVYVVLTVYT